MNTTPGAPPLRARPRRIWQWLLAGTAVGLGAASLAAYNLVTLSRDSTTLRHALISRLPGSARTQVQITVGPILLTVVRMVVSVIPDVPPEAQTALRAVRGASVGVYKLNGERSSHERIEMFSAADDVMRDRGWTRVVGVNDRESLILVYLPSGDRSGSTERVCIAVCNDENLIVVSGSVRVDQLMELVVQQRLIALR